jgi:PiT family inorganic phosphate transporter
MTSLSSVEPSHADGGSLAPRLYRPPDRRLVLTIVAIAAGALLFAAYNILRDVEATRTPVVDFVPYLLLGSALFVALGFEFVNGFHDTANAVATVIYTRSLAPQLAVVWSGFFNILGVLLSSGAVAFSIVSLLPVELILQVGSSAGYAMVFAILIAAILWNLGTWWLGLPASSSHTLIGSIIGVGVANALMSGRAGTAGVDWSQASQIGYALLLSPLVGFIGAALLLPAMKIVVRTPELYSQPKGDAPPPLWVRGLLVLTCTGVSFAHGSNDGQKGMGLIMLILIGTAPTAYALNRALPASHAQNFIEASEAAATVVDARGPGYRATSGEAARSLIARDIAAQEIDEKTYPSLAWLIRDIANRVGEYRSLDQVPATEIGATRNDMYLVSEAVRLLGKGKSPKLFADESEALNRYRADLDNSTKFIPVWVKICVALALGLGTMVGWKRIVVTVGERIGKAHLTYGQGAAAEFVAMATIFAADNYGLPVSTTHVLSSGVAGTMAANGSGVQLATLRNIALAWVLTLPCAVALSALLYWSFAHVF